MEPANGGHAQIWAREVEDEDTFPDPDLWAELKQEYNKNRVQEGPEVLTAAQAPDASNAPFTADEQATIGSKLNEVKQLVRDQFELTAEQLAATDQRLNEAKDGTHQDRKTWLSTLYGAVMSTFITNEIPPHVIQTIVSTVVHGLPTSSGSAAQLR